MITLWELCDKQSWHIFILLFRHFYEKLQTNQEQESKQVKNISEENKLMWN
jgi:hypothetical protein